MPSIFEPTLIRTSGALIDTAGDGETVEMDFDFGNLEGALLLGVEYRGVAFLSALSGTLEVGLNFNGTAVAPPTSASFTVDENVFAYRTWDASLTTSGMTVVGSAYLSLKDLDLVIARNIAFQIFVTGASNLGAVAAVYYKRALFSQNEVGGIVSFRR